MVLCTVEEIRQAERAATQAGRPEHELMIAAGTGFADLAMKRHGDRPGVAVFLVGPGNNGGDGLVAASRLIEHGWHCSVWTYRRQGLAGAPAEAAAARHLHWLTSTGELPEACRDADLIVDAVFGIGGRAELPAEVGDAFAIAHDARIERGVPLWALDLPSGVDADRGAAAETAFMADVTVMLGLPKIGLYKAPALRHTGRLFLVNIGLPESRGAADAPRLIVEQDARGMLPRRRADTHKHAVGWLLVIGGAPDYYGAPRMAAEAAMRVGAGLVCLAVPRSLVGPIASAVPEVTFLPLPEAEFGGAGARMAELVRSALPEYRACVVGPGLSKDAAASDFLANLFGVQPVSRSIGFGGEPGGSSAERFSGRAVVDADGLNWLSTQPGWEDRLSQAELVLTPHPGELSRLTGTSVEEIVGDPWMAARSAAQRFGQVVVLKHAHTVVATPDGALFVGPQSEPALASAGTGDVLAGTIGGLLAQGLSPRDAAITGVCLGSMAAERAVSRVGTLGLIAGDLIDALPVTLRSLYDPAW